MVTSTTSATPSSPTPDHDDVPLCFKVLEASYPDNKAMLGYVWGHYRAEQRNAFEFAGFDEQTMDASWHGPDAVIAEALRQICRACPDIIARIPTKDRWAFAEGWLQAWEDLRSTGRLADAVS